MSYVSIFEAAEILRVSPSTVRSRIKNGEWPFYHFGKRSIRLNLDELADMARLSAKGKSESPQRLNDKGKQDGGSI